MFKITISFLFAVASSLLAQPALSVRTLDFGEVELSWPAAQSGFALETATKVGAGSVWLRVNDPPTLNGQNYSSVILPENQHQFYRLVQIPVSTAWIGGTAGAWEDPMNWQGGVLPTAGGNVRIDTPVSITIKSGTTLNSTITGVSGAKLNVQGEVTFDSAVLNIDFDFGSSTKARVKNGLTVNGVLTLPGGLNLTQLNFEGTQTLDGVGTILMTDPNPNTTQIQQTSGTLTIGPWLTIRGSGRVGSSGFPLINEGTIISDVGGFSRITLAGSTVKNWGTLLAQGGRFIPENIENLGSIQLVNGQMELNGNYQTAQLGEIVGTNGVVDLTGTLHNEGQTLKIAKGVTWELLGGIFLGGTILPGEGRFVVRSSPAILDAVTVNGEIVINFAARLRVTNGFTLNGTARLEGNLNITRLIFDGSQTLDGSGLVLFTDTNPVTTVIETTNGTLTIGPQITISGGSGTIGNVALPLVNQGKIVATGAGTQLRIFANPFNNTGVIQELDGGRVLINP
jgi:hypothetical protein